MTLISLDLNLAHQTAGCFSTSGNTLDDMCGNLQRHWSALASTWEGDSKYDVAGEVNAVLNRGGHCADLTCERGAKLVQIADQFQAADENEPAEVRSVGALGKSPLESLLDFWNSNKDELGLAKNVAKKAGDLFKLEKGINAALSLAFVAGSTYPDQIKIYGEEALKKLAGISSNLTHIAEANLPGHIANQAAKGAILGSVIAVGGAWIEDIQKYGDKGAAKLGSAMVIDGALAVGATVGASYVGAYAGAIIGQALIPIPGVGAVIGGLVGKVAAGWVASAAVDAFKNSDLHETIVNGVADGVTALAHGAEQAFSSTVKAIQDIPWPKLPKLF